MRKRGQPVLILVLALVAAASMWFYVNKILRAHQTAYAKQRQIPRGNLSDLYPRWWGAHELLLHHRNPYSQEVTLEIQEGYYGRRLDAGRPEDPKDQQGFAYPVYIVFFLSPLIGLPFDVVLTVFYWFLASITAISVWLWMNVLKWRPTFLTVALGFTLALGSFSAVQGIKLQQLSLLAAALLAGAAFCASNGYLFVGGTLLAGATIKPQLAWALTAWLLVWAASDWRTRRRLVIGFGSAMMVLLVGAEIILPGWIRMFAEAVGRYHQYTQNQSVLDALAPWGLAGKILGLLAVLVSLPLLWKFRTSKSETEDFGHSIAFVLALTVLVVPMYAPYNQVLLIPTVLRLLQDWQKNAWLSRNLRLSYVAVAIALSWQWIASASLSIAYVFAPAWAMEHWMWPFFATLTVPILLFALMYLSLKRSLEMVEQH